MNEPKNKGLGGAIAAAVVSNGIFGFSFMFSSVALKVTTPETLLMLRFLLAFALISVIAFFMSRKKDAPQWLRFSLKGKPILPLLGLGVLQPVVYFLCENWGVKLTNSTVGGVIIALIPIVAMSMGRVFLREKVQPLQWVFALVSIAGVVLMTTQQTAEGDIQLAGVLLLMGAALAAGLFNISSRKLSAAYSPLESTFVMMGVGAAVFTVMALIRGVDLTVLGSWQVIAALVYLAVLSSIAAFLLLNYANSRLPVARATAFCNVTTVLSLFAGVVFLGDPFNALILLAAVLILAGIVGVQRFARSGD